MWTPVIAAGGAVVAWSALRGWRVRSGMIKHGLQLPPASQYYWRFQPSVKASLPDAEPVPHFERSAQDRPTYSAHKRADRKEAELPGTERWPAFVDGVLAGVAPAIALANVDMQVVDALDFATQADLSRFDNLQELVASTHSMSADSYAGWLTRLKGYVGEQAAADVLESQGYDVAWPELANNPGWDLLVDGHEYNVKVGQGVDHILEHFDKYPDVGVITSPELAAQLPGGLQDRVMAFDDLDDDALVERTTDTLENIDAVDFGPAVPWFTVAFSGLREIDLLFRESTTVATAAKNVGLDVLGTGAGGWVGGKLGAGIGTAIFPGIGTVAVGIVGAIVGGIFGRNMTNGIKMKAYKEAVAKYEHGTQYARARIAVLHATVVANVRSGVAQAEKTLVSDIRAVELYRFRRTQAAKAGFRDQCNEFTRELPDMLTAAEAKLAAEQQVILGAMPRSHVLLRALWPAERDIAYRAAELWFEARRGELRAAAAQLPDQLHDLTPAERMSTVKAFLADKRFNQDQMDDAVAEIAREYQRTLTRCEIEQQLARREIRKACVIRAQALHTIIRGQLSGIGPAVTALTAPLRSLRDRVKTEGIKLGLNK